MNEAKADFFNSQVAEPWAASEFGPLERAKIDRMLRQAQIREGMSVIEPGCGTGRLTAILADVVGPEGFVHALDISPKMVEAARQRVGTCRNVCVECAAIEGCSFHSQSYDVVVCHNVFPHFDNKPAAVARLASALKIGGGFIVFHFMSAAEINDMHRKAHTSVLNDLIPPEPEMRRIFEVAGFQVELIKDDEEGYLLSATRTRVIDGECSAGDSSP